MKYAIVIFVSFVVVSSKLRTQLIADMTQLAVQESRVDNRILDRLDVFQKEKKVEPVSFIQTQLKQQPEQTSIDDIKIVKKKFSAIQKQEQTKPDDHELSKSESVSLVETDKRPSEYRPAWQQRYEEQQKELPPIKKAAKQAIEFTNRLDAKVRAEMNLEPYEGLAPPAHELPLKIRDFAKEELAKKMQEEAQKSKEEESELTQDKFVKMLPDDLQKRLQEIEKKVKQRQQEDEEKHTENEDEGAEHEHEHNDEEKESNGENGESGSPEVVHEGEQRDEQTLEDHGVEFNDEGQMNEDEINHNEDVDKEENIEEEKVEEEKNGEEKIEEEKNGEEESPEEKDEMGMENEKGMLFLNHFKISKVKVEEKKAHYNENQIKSQQKEHESMPIQNTIPQKLEKDDNEVLKKYKNYDQPEEKSKGDIKEKVQQKMQVPLTSEQNDILSRFDSFQKEIKINKGIGQPEIQVEDQQEVKIMKKKKEKKLYNQVQEDIDSQQNIVKPPTEIEDTHPKESQRKEIPIQQESLDKTNPIPANSNAEQKSLTPTDDQDFTWLQDTHHQLTKEEFISFLNALQPIPLEQQFLALKYTYQKTNLKDDEELMQVLIEKINKGLILVTLEQVYYLSEGMDDEAQKFSKKQAKSMNIRRTKEVKESHSINISDMRPQQDQTNETVRYDEKFQRIVQETPKQNPQQFEKKNTEISNTINTVKENESQIKQQSNQQQEYQKWVKQEQKQEQQQEQQYQQEQPQEQQQEEEQQSKQIEQTQKPEISQYEDKEEPQFQLEYKPKKRQVVDEFGKIIIINEEYEMDIQATNSTIQNQQNKKEDQAHQNADQPQQVPQPAKQIQSENVPKEQDLSKQVVEQDPVIQNKQTQEKQKSTPKEEVIERNIVQEDVQQPKSKEVQQESQSEQEQPLSRNDLYGKISSPQVEEKQEKPEEKFQTSQQLDTIYQSQPYNEENDQEIMKEEDQSNNNEKHVETPQNQHLSDPQMQESESSDHEQDEVLQTSNQNPSQKTIKVNENFALENDDGIVENESHEKQSQIHDEQSQSHEKQSQSYDEQSQSREKQSQIHDAQSQSHEKQSQSYDEQSQNHDEQSQNHDEQSQSHDEQSQNHDEQSQELENEVSDEGGVKESYDNEYDESYQQPQRPQNDVIIIRNEKEIQPQEDKHGEHKSTSGSKVKLTDSQNHQQPIQTHQVSPHNDEFEKEVAQPQEQEDSQLEDFLKQRGLEREEKVPEDQDEIMDDEFQEYVKIRQTNQKPENDAIERIVVQYPAKPQRVQTSEDELSNLEIDSRNQKYLAKSQDIFDKPGVRNQEDIFQLQSLAAGKFSNVKSMEDLIIVDNSNKSKDALKEDLGIHADHSKHDQKFERWQKFRNNDQQHGEREMENKAMKNDKEQLLPDQQPRMQVVPSPKTPIPSPMKNQLIQQAESHVNLNTIQCKDTYGGTWDKAKSFVCDSCRATETVILDEDSWYLVGMVGFYQKSYQPFLNELKTLFSKQTTLLAFGRDQVCFAGEKLNTRVNITQLMTLFQHHTQKSSSLIIQMPDILNTSYIQVRYIPNADIKFQNIQIEASEPINVNLQQGLSVQQIGAELIDNATVITYVGQLKIQHQSINFNHHLSIGPDVQGQYLELEIELPQNYQLLIQLCEQEFGNDLKEQLLRYLTWRNTKITNQNLRVVSQRKKLIIEVIGNDDDFDFSFKLKSI